MDRRPDPDRLLEHVQREEGRLKRGRLKIFLGYAAGVGKTYAMLEAAQQRIGEGIDVVVGYVETHGRAETEALLAGLAIVPRREIPYRGITLTEMDLDAILLRDPNVVLVDELAHTNVPGSRHGKRYQDVLELLNAGIDVYTTLNIQHLESLNDVVARITEVPVRETVPDHVLDDADEIELIDLPTDELLQRLEEGKVYVPEQAERAVRRFFRPGNLNALRELAFRRAADRIDEKMRAYMHVHGIRGIWPAAERLLVCVGPSPLAERLVRTGRRLATRFNAEWFAIYVETAAQAALSEAEHDRIARALALAESLGGKSVRLPGNDIAETIVSFAHSYNVTQIVAGKPLRPRWRELLRGSLVDRIVRLSQDSDVYIISSDPRRLATESLQSGPLRRTEAGRYLYSTGLVILATVLGLPLRPFIDPTNLVMLYLLAVILAALRLGRRPAIVASLLSVVAFDVVFVPPYYTFVVADAQFLLTFAGLLGAGLVISSLAASVREQARFAQRREAHTAVLYELSRDLAAAAEAGHVAQLVVKHVEQVMRTPAAVFIDADGRIELSNASPRLSLDEDEYAVATWAFFHHEPAGRGTETLAGADGFYLPLATARDVVGVLAVLFPEATEADRPMTAEQRRLLESFSSQAAVAIERSLLAEKAQEAQLLQETEKLQTALLNSISHDLRTPLASITGALSSLRDAGDVLDERTQLELVTNALDEAERLNRLVGNLLNMTRLQSGAMRIAREVQDVEDVIGVALAQLMQRLQEREFAVEIASNVPLVPMDFVLMVQVFVNLLENAIKYTQPGTPIEIRARTRDNELLVEVMDRGPGIPPDKLERIFDKFYRVQGYGEPTSSGGPSGSGLGLSISRGIVEAHGGRIWAENRQGGGAVFKVALPLSSERSHPTGEQGA